MCVCVCVCVWCNVTRIILRMRGAFLNSFSRKSETPAERLFLSLLLFRTLAGRDEGEDCVSIEAHIRILLVNVCAMFDVR